MRWCTAAWSGGGCCTASVQGRSGACPARGDRPRSSRVGRVGMCLSQLSGQRDPRPGRHASLAGPAAPGRLCSAPPPSLCQSCSRTASPLSTVVSEALPPPLRVLPERQPAVIQRRRGGGKSGNMLERTQSAGLMGVRRCLTVGLIRTSPVVNDAGHLFCAYWPFVGLFGEMSLQILCAFFKFIF